MNQMNSESEDGPGNVICATRGGEGSEPTIRQAIEIARERGLRLTFLYIADLQFMRHITTGHASLAAEELRKMGEFIMTILVEQAQAEGVEADFAVRKGRFRDELLRYLEETRPAMLVLGSPKPGTACLDSASLERLMREIKEQSGVPVMCA